MASLATDCSSGYGGRHNEALLFRSSFQPTDTVRNSETYSPDDVAGGLGLWRGSSGETGLVGKKFLEGIKGQGVHDNNITEAGSARESRLPRLTYQWAGSRGVTSKP